MSAAFWKGAARGVMDFCGAIAGIGMLLGLLWLLGNPIIRDYVYEKSGTSPAMVTVREDVDGIMADRKELTKKREQQFDAVTKQINELTLKVEGTNQRISTQIEGLTTLVARLNTQLDSLHGRLPLRTGSTIKMQDRISAEGDAAP